MVQEVHLVYCHLLDAGWRQRWDLGRQRVVLTKTSKEKCNSQIPFCYFQKNFPLVLLKRSLKGQKLS